MDAKQKDLKECKYCKSLIAADATICPVCKKRQDSTAKKITLGVLIGIIIISIIGLIFFSDNTASTPELNYSEDYSYQEEEPPQEIPQQPDNLEQSPENTLALGQSHDFNGLELTVNSISEWEGNDYYELPSNYTYLMLNITIKNNSGEERSPYDLMFTGYVDGKNIDEEFVGDNYLKGNDLISNTYTTGDISFVVPTNWNTFQLRAEDWESNQTVVYNLSKDQVTVYDHHEDHHDEDYDY